jgi:hypothetical protein
VIGGRGQMARFLTIALAVFWGGCALGQAKDPYTAALVCSVTGPWAADMPAPVVESRVVIVPATGIDNDLVALSKGGDSKLFLGRIGVGMVEIRGKGAAQGFKYDFVQTQAGDATGFSIEGFAYSGIYARYALRVDTWEKGKPIKVYSLKGGTTATGNCE